MKLGNNIQFLRTNMCLSQEELATDDIPANETDAHFLIAGSIPKFV